MTPYEQNRLDGRALIRIAREVREMIDVNGPAATPVLDDLATLERVGKWLLNTPPISGHGIMAAGSAQLPSLGTARRPEQEQAP